MKLQNLSTLSQVIHAALEEDVGAGDITSRAFIDKNRRAVARIVAQESGVVCGLELVRLIYQHLSTRATLRVHLLARDGQKVQPGKAVCEIRGLAQHILTGERTVLNFLQRLSGIATLTRAFVDKVQSTRAKILDTRKTTPGWRALEKYAVRCGGGTNHRMGLYDAALIKDNHLALYNLEKQSGRFAFERKVVALKKRKPNLFVEVEVQKLRDLFFLTSLPVDALLLDNFRPAELRKAVAQVRRLRGKRIILEASGGVTLDNVRAIAKTGVDWISVGALTHSAKALNFSMELRSLK